MLPLVVFLEKEIEPINDANFFNYFASLFSSEIPDKEASQVNSSEKDNCLEILLSLQNFGKVNSQRQELSLENGFEKKESSDKSLWRKDSLENEIIERKLELKNPLKNIFSEEECLDCHEMK